MIGYLSIRLERMPLAPTTSGMLRPRPKIRSQRLPWEAPATASTLSSDMVMSATKMIHIALMRPLAGLT